MSSLHRFISQLVAILMMGLLGVIDDDRHKTNALIEQGIYFDSDHFGLDLILLDNKYVGILQL